MKKVILTVLGADRPGIVADVTGLLFDSGCNIEDSSMTILEGEFAMLVIVSLARDLSYASLQKKFAPLERKSKLSVTIKEFKARPKTRKEFLVKNYVISVIGADKPGIVHQVSKLLAQHKINITDVDTKRIGKGPEGVYAMILEANIPSEVNVPELERELEDLGKGLAVDVTLKPIESLTL